MQLVFACPMSKRNNHKGFTPQWLAKPPLPQKLCSVQGNTEAKNYTSLDPICGNKIPEKRWVWSQLHHHFGNVLHVSCRHFCYGTALYHKDCVTDLVNAISVALGRSKVECLLCTDATTQQQGRIRASHDDETILTRLPTLHVQMKVILL